jgi:hypothetical protein
MWQFFSTKKKVKFKIEKNSQKFPLFCPKEQKQFGEKRH